MSVWSWPFLEWTLPPPSLVSELKVLESSDIQVALLYITLFLSFFFFFYITLFHCMVVVWLHSCQVIKSDPHFIDEETEAWS